MALSGYFYLAHRNGLILLNEVMSLSGMVSMK